MAYYGKHSSLLFFLFLALFYTQIHARENKFFSKITRSENPKEFTPVATETPSVKEEPASLPADQQSHHGYGLYGHGPERFIPTTTATSNYATHNYYNGDKVSGSNANSFPSSFRDTELTNERNENREYNSAYNYGNQLNYESSIPSTSANKYENKEEWNNYGEPRKQYSGMSDTRFLENGRYYYDVDSERNGNRYETYPKSGNPEGYRPYDRVPKRRGNYGSGGYNSGNVYEQNSEREDYRNNQEFEENQEEYVP